jgi:tetratricopeptide (TPR) repeat protein
VGSVPRNFLLKGKMKTNSQGILRVADPKTGDWFLLSKTDGSFVDSPEELRKFGLSRGGVRWHGFSTSLKESSKDASKETGEAAISTPEILVQPSKGADVFVTRVPAPANKKLQAGGTNSGMNSKSFQDMSVTRVVVIAGKVEITVYKTPSGKPSKVSLPAGIEFTIFENGFVQPLGKPNPSKMEKLLSLTITPEELTEQAKLRSKAGAADLSKSIASAEQSLKEEDYFEMLNSLVPVESRANEDIRIPYLLGVANKGVYQVSSAQKFFEKALAQNENHTPSYLQLALIHMEQKNWVQAEKYFQELDSRTAANDPIRNEIPYYKGVAQFQQNDDFSARNSFTQSLWNTELDNALKESAGNFMQTLRKRKNWSLSTPVGIQWDGNPLGLTKAESVPPEFPQKSLYRSFLGALWNYDSSATASKDGVYLGGGLKAIALLNAPRGFSELDVYLFDASFSQTILSTGSEDGKESADSVKISESIAGTWLNKKLATQGFQLGVSWNIFDVNVGYEIDAVGKGSENRNAILGRETVSPVLWTGENGVTLGLDVEANQRLHVKTNESKGIGLGLRASPNLQVSLSPRLNNRSSVFAEYERESTKIVKSGVKAGVSNSVNYFLTPWLLASFTLSFEQSWLKNSGGVSSKAVSKPGAGLMFTGLF